MNVLHRQKQRQGAIVVLTAFLMIAMLAFVAFAVDLGYVACMRTEVQRSADAGALAGASMMGIGLADAEIAARQFVANNPVGKDTIPYQQVNIEFGSWNPNTRTFLVDPSAASAIRVSASQPDRPYFFARALGKSDFEATAEAIAVYEPRDIMVVLDYSASMNDDSELKHIPLLGRTAIETNMLQIYNELGAPVLGSMQWNPVYIGSTNSNVIAAQLGVDTVPFPYPGGSWNDFFNYVQTNSVIQDAGYRRRYGYLTLVNYLLHRRPSFNDTPDLWQTSEQPITAVKDSLTLFMAYMAQSPTEDQIGLAIYTAADGNGKLEVGLTDDFASVEQTSRQRQAGHYQGWTNIGGGLQKARIEMEDNGRPTSAKLIVLMTDGIANRPTNTTVARQFLIQEANLCADNEFPVLTISLGINADTALMQQVADITNGMHFNIPGGGSVASYEEDLKDAFKEIAAYRPLKLVK